MKTETLSEYDPMVAMNEALLLGSLRQHELTEAAEKLNEQLRVEIAERKNAEEQLRISESRYRRLFEVSQDGILILDSETGKITDANPSIFNLTGDPGKQIVGKALWEIGLFKNKEAGSQMLRELKDKGFCHREDVPVITKGGQLISVDFFSNLYKENGVKVIQCNLRDITRRKQTERLLAEKARLIDLSNDAIVVRDLNDRIRLWNKGAEKLFGWSLEEVVGKDLHSLLHTEFPRPYVEIVAELYRAGRFNAEVVQIARDGQRVRSLCGWVLDRETESIFTSYTDITARTQAEEALRTSEEFNRSIIQSSPDCIKILDLEGNLLSMQNGEDLLGIEDINPFLNKSWFELWSGEDRAAAQAEFKKASAGQDGNFIGSTPNLRGQLKCWDVSISPILDATGKIHRLLAVARDITERRKGEIALRESEERYRYLFNSIDEGFAVVEMIFDEQKKPVDYRYLEINPSFEKQSGLKETLGKRQRELVSDFETYWFEIFGRVALTGEPNRFINEAKGLNRWFDVFAFRVGEEGSGKVAVLFNNITERMVSEEKLRHAQMQLSDRAVHLAQAVAERTSELGATNKQLEAFVYSIAHDLRAPLRSMQGFSEMLVEEAAASLSENARDCAGRINRSAGYMDDLLQDLLAFSVIAQQKLELVSVNLELLIQSVLARMENEIHEKKAQVEIAGRWPVVLAHETTLGQVMFNLLNNALKFSRPGVPPQIRVHAKDDDGFVRVSVEDNGIGILPNHQEQIFRLFTRLQGDMFSGTGIGLAIVQKGVERMGGKSGVESTPEKGSRFWFDVRAAG